MSGKRTPSWDVLKRLHEVLFAPSPAELVASVELKVMAWKKGGRSGRAPWGAEVKFAYATGYDGHSRVASLYRMIGHWTFRIRDRS